MDTVIDDDHRIIRDAVREFLEAESTPARVRAAELDGGVDLALWRAFCRLGWAGVALSSEAGGQGLALTQLGIVFEELGRHIAPVPAHGTLVVAHVLDRHARSEFLRAPLADLAEGRFVAALGLTANALPDAVAGHGSLIARRVDGGLVIDGKLPFVDGHAVADAILVSVLVPAEDGTLEPAVALLDANSAGIRAVQLVTTAKDSQSELVFEAVHLADKNLIATGAKAAEILHEAETLAIALNVALMVGGARRTLDFAAAYACDRVAFGHPIGAFQAIQHLSADMLNAVDGAELLVREAIWRLENGLPASVEASQAKAFASERCVMVCRSAQQIHGGIGFMMEFDLQLWYRRVLAWSLRCGRASAHRARIATALLDGPNPVRLDQPLYFSSAIRCEPSVSGQ